jgi:hypothetical protein
MAAKRNQRDYEGPAAQDVARRPQRGLQIGVKPDRKPEAQRPIQAEVEVLHLSRGGLHLWR